MKRFVLFLLAFSFLCSLVSCAKTPATQPRLPASGEEEILSPETEPLVIFDGEFAVYKAFADAFLNKDAKAMADFFRSPDPEKWDERERGYERWYQALSSVTFGESRFEKVDKDGARFLRFTFEVTESDFERFPIGTYEYSIESSPAFTVSWRRISPAALSAPDSVYRLLYFLGCGVWDKTDLNKTNETNNFYLLDAVFAYAAKVRGTSTDEVGLSAAEIEAYAVHLFGCDLSLDCEALFTKEKDGLYYMGGHGGSTVSREIVSVRREDGRVVLDVRFFADVLCIANSHLVRYTFEETGDAFGARLLDVERLETGECDPYIRSV